MSAEKAKGTQAETAVARWLQQMGFKGAERRTTAGSKDRGDIAGIPGLVIEVKNHRALDLAGWLTEAKREAAVGRFADVPVVWHKRRGEGSPGDWYVTMDGWAFAALLERWTDGDR